MVAYSRIDVADAAPPGARTHSVRRRFDDILITSVFGEPLQPRTWSGAPFNLAGALKRRGVAVAGANPHSGRMAKLLYAGRHLVSGYGRLRNTAQLLRELPARRHHAEQVEAMVERVHARNVLHTGTLDLPVVRPRDGVRHYLYCDHTWAMARDFRAGADGCSARALREYEQLECKSLMHLDHIFTFASCVRDNIVTHYGIPANRVSAVGSGMGSIEPFFGIKTYSPSGPLLFVAKHLFREKGGELLVEAFMSLRPRRPDLRLIIVGDERSRRFVPESAGIDFRPRLAWEELQELYRSATLLVQPMLNDPWGQVFLEAMVSRTPVVGLNRNGLPEITAQGRYGFLVDRPEPDALAAAIVDALSSPDRLGWMGVEGQRHVLRHYSWDAVADRMLAA